MKKLEDIKELEKEKAALKEQLKNVEKQLRKAKGIACTCGLRYTLGDSKHCANCGGVIPPPMRYER